MLVTRSRHNKLDDIMQYLILSKCICLTVVLLSRTDGIRAEPILPVFAGTQGIDARVLGPACSGCHDSSVTGPARRGAPLWLNWNNYPTTLQHAGRIVHSATVSRHMPPANSGFALLDAEQTAALLAWEDAGYPETASVTTAGATFNPTTGQLSLPGVAVGIGHYEVRLRLLSTTSTAGAAAFEVLTILPVTHRDTVASYDGQSGLLQIPRVQVLNGITEALAATMQLVSTVPMVFELHSVQMRAGH